MNFLTLRTLISGSVCGERKNLKSKRNSHPTQFFKYFGSDLQNSGCERINKNINKFVQTGKTDVLKNYIMTNDMSYGQNNEAVAITLFVEQYKKTVRLAGLFIDEEYGVLGASPDGVVQNENAILEIKCFPSLARNNQNIVTAAKDRKNFALTLNKEGCLEINKKHNYYYQIQGQLRVTKKDYCYFVCYVAPTLPIEVLKIERNEVFIQDMTQKLLKFFKTSVLPEIILRKIKKNEKCLDLYKLN